MTHFDPHGLPPQPERGWFARNMLWFLPLVLVILSSPFICCAGMGYWGYGLITAPRDAAAATLNDDARVTDKIGSPNVVGSGFTSDNFKSENGNGESSITFNVNGPKGSAFVSGDMKQTAGKWRAEMLTVDFDDGTTLKIPE